MQKEAYGLISKDGIQVPLAGVEVHGDILGRSAKVTVVQHFRNTEQTAVEAVCKFPLPEASSVHGFKVVIGDRVIEGSVEEREKAFELYDRAVSEGHGGYLLDEERPNIFTLSVGNLNPGAEARIEIRYVTLLDTNDNEVRFFLPTTISPRYVPSRMPDEQGIPVAGIVNPPFSDTVRYGFNLTLRVNGIQGIEKVESPSHPVSITFLSDQAVVELVEKDAVMDRDFVLTVKYKEAFRTRGYFCKSDNGSFVQVDFACPQFDDDGVGENGKAALQEVIFLLDCSGSMMGSSIAQAKGALEILLRALPQQCLFNIYRFGSSFELLAPASVPYSAETVKKALKWLSGVNADLGGTEILAPIASVCDGLQKDSGATSLLLITDGQVGNEDEILSLLRQHATSLRIFSVGIGHGPNEYFIKEVTRITGGAYELVAPQERIETRILRLFNKVLRTPVTDLVLDGPAVLEQVPPFPVVFGGEAVSVFARLKDGVTPPATLTLKAKRGDQDLTWQISLQPLEAGDRDHSVQLLWAREMIRALEAGEASGRGSTQKDRSAEDIKQRIVDLSKAYGLISRETSFVVIETRSDDEKTVGQVEFRKIHVMLTKDWHGRDMRGLRGPAPCASFMQSDFLLDDSDFLLDDTVMEDRCMLSMDLPAKPFLRRKIASDYPLLEGKHHREEVPDIHEILSCQRPEGGFALGGRCADLLGLSLEEIGELANRMALRDMPIEVEHTLMEMLDLLRRLRNQSASTRLPVRDHIAEFAERTYRQIEELMDALHRERETQELKALLLSTTVALWVLDHRYASERDVWSGITVKSRRWLDDQVHALKPSVDGVPLEEWVGRYMAKTEAK